MTEKKIQFLTGPVQMYPNVREAFLEEPFSHRSKKFSNEVAELKEKLCLLTQAQNVQIISGSGTLANDIIAMQLRSIPGTGLILSNGEFGERLIHQASRCSLTFHSYRIKPGEEFDLHELYTKIQEFNEISWIWMVHSETSTGVLNDLQRILNLGKDLNIKVCADCMSSIGNVPLDLKDVYLASASSNKGLGSLPGIALVFHQDEVIKNTAAVPVYLDLSHYVQKKGIPFTLSSNAVRALDKALNYIDHHHFRNISTLSAFLFQRLDEQDYYITAKNGCRNPAVFNIELPSTTNSSLFGNYLVDNNIYVSFESEYLKRMNAIQISLMGNHTMEEIELLLSLMDSCNFKHYHDTVVHNILSQ